MVKFRYTDEMKDWLRAHSKGVPYDKLAAKFNRRFGLSKTARQIQSACHDHGAHNGVYIINHPCHKCHWRPVGATRIDKDGYVRIKTKEPCYWKLAHIHEWEKHHGKFNKNKYIIMFIDGDRTNWHIDNLRKYERRIIGAMNRWHLMPELRTPEMFDAAVLLAKSKIAINDATFRTGKHATRTSAAASVSYRSRSKDPKYLEKRRKYARETARKRRAENRELYNQKQRDYRARKSGKI
ncbi:MAG: HNH endonuclease [Alphaproteobacteria bacterium]|nr:HNH endonuclease [Alphaproteobacteria bacterium]